MRVLVAPQWCQHLSVNSLISIGADGIEHIFACLFAICIFSFGEIAIQILCPFSGGLFVILLLSYKNSANSTPKSYVRDMICKYFIIHGFLLFHFHCRGFVRTSFTLAQEQFLDLIIP